MPYLRVELAGPVGAEERRALLVRTAEVFAEIAESPIERIRTQVVELPADAFAVGGVPIAESGQQAPMICIDLIKGRTPDRYVALIEHVSAVVADTLGIPVDSVRVRINEIPPVQWGIAGRPASETRAAEIAARATGA